MIKEELLLFVEIEDRAVMVFVDWDLGTGVDEKDAGDPSLKWNKGALFAKNACFYIFIQGSFRQYKNWGKTKPSK